MRGQKCATEFSISLARVCPDIEIAAVLTAEGHIVPPNCHEKVLTNTVQRIRHVAGIQGSAPRKDDGP